MTAEKTSPILRLEDGSIDYRYYEACGLKARNEEIKTVIGKLRKTRCSRSHAFPAIATVILLVILL